ncbi:LytR/AlgR family response regulator transcription factor [Niabella hirudinis]|uniref:LytR/AlgR family response regulator transcription factor n=1 Tax=Niabella hirudinis TaxID=1285929 RepID=UPI003EBD1EC0
MSFKIQIVEEDRVSWNLLKFKMETVTDSQLQFLEYCSSMEQAIGAIFMHRPDILIFDLRLLKNKEFEIIENLVNQKILRVKIMVTASPNQLNQLQNIIDMGVTSLIMKPINSNDLRKSMGRVIGLLHEEAKEVIEDHFITLKANRSLLYVNQRDILFVESNRNICEITFKDGTQKTVNENITFIDQRIHLKELVRIDKSTIINISKIVYLDSDVFNKECKLKLSNGGEINKSLSKIGMSRLYKIVSHNRKNEGRIVF